VRIKILCGVVIGKILDFGVTEFMQCSGRSLKKWIRSRSVLKKGTSSRSNSYFFQTFTFFENINAFIWTLILFYFYALLKYEYKIVEIIILYCCFTSRRVHWNFIYFIFIIRNILYIMIVGIISQYLLNIKYILTS